MNIFLFLSAILPLINTATYYMNEESLATPQTGSLTNPFTSIAQAYSSLGPITCDLALLGSNASISTPIVFKSGSNYTIRPDANFNSTHFPIYLQPGAVIQITSATIVLKKLQFVELNPSRSSSSPLFKSLSRSRLTFKVPSASIISYNYVKSVLIRDIGTAASFYYFCDAYDSFVNVIDSEFRNLTDLQVGLTRSPIVVHRSRFADLTYINAPLFYLASYLGPNDGFAFKNNSFENISISNTTGGGFIRSIYSHMNVTFEDFYINNVTFRGEDPFLRFSASNSLYYDTPNNQTTLTIRNGVIKNILEKHGVSLATISSPSFSLFINSNAQTILKVQNLSVINSIFTRTNQFIDTWKVLPSIELTDITMKYTRNANFLIFRADTVNISNVYLEGLSIKDVTTTYPMFRLSSGHLINVNNVTANNVTGPLFHTIDVLAHNFSTFSLNNMYTSEELPPGRQNIITFTKMTNPAEKGLDTSKPQDILLDNINLNGYTRIEGIDETKSANFSFLVMSETVYGRVYLTNSVWQNNLMNGFYCSFLPYFEVNNLTIDHDPETPRKQIPPHKGFYLTSVKEMVVKNSVFQNNQNYVVLNSYNIPRRGDNDQLTETFLNFENITVLNNSAVFYDLDSPDSSLFMIYSPMKPITILAGNSYFDNNKNLNGLFNSFENYQVMMNFTNNTFDNNYAIESGAVFSSKNMRQQTSSLILKSNKFTNNNCDQNGGVFSFILTDYRMHSVDNTYKNNTASLAGGVGYAFRASFVFLEEGGVYLTPQMC